MKCAFFGTSQFAVPALSALLNSRYEVKLVVTQPDRPKGRYLLPTPSPIKVLAEEKGLKIVYEPSRAATERGIDLYVVVAYGKILSSRLLSTPKYGAINLHASLLPKYRGAAPINWAIVKGERETGVTVIKMNERMDAGDIILARREPIRGDDDAQTLAGRLAGIGAKLLVEAVDAIEQGAATFTPQDESLATYAPMLKKEDGKIDWAKSPTEILNHIRGMQPWPGAFTRINGVGTHCNMPPLKIYGAKITEDGRLAITELQLEGSKRMPFEEFRRGHKEMAEKLCAKIPA